MLFLLAYISLNRLLQNMGNSQLEDALRLPPALNTKPTVQRMSPYLDKEKKSSASGSQEENRNTHFETQQLADGNKLIDQLSDSLTTPRSYLLYFGQCAAVSYR